MMNKLKTFWSKTNRWHRILLFFFLVESRLIPGGQIGFECNDPALSHSFTGDTINFKWLFAVTTLLPLIIVLLVERLQERSSSSKDQALRWYREYLFGLLLNVTVVQVLKLAVGSPRPHFFETCQPVEATTCKGSEYVERYSCTQAHWLQQSDKSFPSGHTSLAVHSAVFIYYYLQQRAMKDSAWVRGVQLASVTGAAVCGVSRMTDHRHHWWDVLAGTILALPILYYTMYHSCGNFVCQIPREKQPEKCEAAREDSAKATL